MAILLDPDWYERWAMDPDAGIASLALNPAEFLVEEVEEVEPVEEEKKEEEPVASSMPASASREV